MAQAERTLTSQLKAKTGQKVSLAGWLHKKRLLGGVNFILLRDRAGVAQIKVEDEKEVEKLRNLQIGTVLRIAGQVVEDERAPGGVEVHEPKLEVVSPVTNTPPIEVDKPIDHNPKNHDTLFEHRVVNLRNLGEQGIFKIQHHITGELHKHFRGHDFIEIHTPKLLSGATEGGAEVFKLDYFDREATLAQSPQFYKQIMVGVFERVYEIAPAYRAEPSQTTRHMSEYISVDGEMGFVESAADVMDYLSGLLNALVDGVWAQAGAELKELKATKPKLAKKLPVITLTDLHEKYVSDTGDDTSREPDPTPAEERWVSEWAEREHGSEAVFVTDFPAREAKFYHYVADGSATAERFDLIFRGVEIVTGSIREHRYEKLVEKIKDIGGDPDHPGFKYLVEAMRYGMPPHGGFGLGLERLTQKLIGLDNVKEATLFPRDMNRLTP